VKVQLYTVETMVEVRALFFIGEIVFLWIQVMHFCVAWFVLGYWMRAE